MIVVIGIAIAIPIVAILAAFDAWHCSNRTAVRKESASLSRRV